MKPRIIHAANGTFDATKVAFVSQIKKISSEDNKFHFGIGVNGEVFTYDSDDLNLLIEWRRRLIGFVWPNAHVFSIDSVA